MASLPRCLSGALYSPQSRMWQVTNIYRLQSKPMNTRRQFLISAPLGALVAASACRSSATPNNSPSAPTTAGAPPTFGAGAGSGPEVTAQTFAEAEKLMQVTMTPAERQQAAGSWRQSLAQYLERRTGPRK